MSAREIDAQSQGFERDEGLRNDGRRRRERNDVRNRPGGRCATKRTVCELAVASRVVVPMMGGRLRLVGGGTHFQQERRTARRHEADGYVGPKQEDYQQQTGE
jgi:hypothetical protein